MMIVMKPTATEEQIQAVIHRIEQAGAVRLFAVGDRGFEHANLAMWITGGGIPTSTAALEINHQLLWIADFDEVRVRSAKCTRRVRAPGNAVPPGLQRTEGRDRALSGRSGVTATENQANGDHNRRASRTGGCLHDSPVWSRGRMQRKHQNGNGPRPCGAR